MREKSNYTLQCKGGEFNIFCPPTLVYEQIYGVGEQAHYNSHDKYGTHIPRPRVCNPGERGLLYT